MTVVDGAAGTAAGSSPVLLEGIGICPGRAAGPVALMGQRPRLPADHPAVADTEAEIQSAIAALGLTADDLEARAAGSAVPGAAEVLEATAMIARDPSLEEAIRSAITKGEPAAWAVDRAIDAFKAMLLDLGGYMADRVGDLDDVRDRTLARLLGQPMPGVPERDVPFILVADDLAPADTVTLTTERVLALVTIRGGPTSHTAILARSLGLPAVVACAGAAALREGALVEVDGGLGQVRVGVTPDEAAESNRAEQARRSARAASRGPGRTADGHAVALLLNIGDAAGAAKVATVDAEGVGLFRTEFLYLDRQDAPSVDEQVSLYTAVFEAMGGRKIVVRTLDAGADKPLPFLDQAGEPNPALGVRGLRIARRSPDVLTDQLAALALAQKQTGAVVWVMAPMVATAAEAKGFTDLAHGHGLPVAGVMVEIPAAALRARDLLEHTDFLSIGTNDLAQYTLAADRMAGELADLLDPWQPALLDLIRMTAEAGLAAGKPVGVCGEAAASPALAPVLVGLGITSLSMSATAVADVRDALAAVTLAECREMAASALVGETPDLAELSPKRHPSVIGLTSPCRTLRGQVGNRRHERSKEDLMRRLLLAGTTALLAVTAVAGPVGARDFGAVYANDAVYRVFGNAANVPDGTGTDPFATFTNSTNTDQLGVAEFAPGSPTGHHGGRWAVYRATWTSGDSATLITSWSELQSYVASGELSLVRDAAADFRCPVLGNPEPIS